RGSLHLAIQPIDVRIYLLARRFLLGRGEIERGFEVARAVAERPAVEVAAGEKRQQPEGVLLGERIVLMVVALRAGERGTEPDGGRRVGAVHEYFVVRLFGIDAALFRGHLIS